MATRNISTKLAIEGESEYKASISRINSEIKTLQSELRKTESEFEGNANSIEALTAKGDALSAVFAEQQNKVSQLQDALENAKSAEAEYASKHDELTAKIDENNEALERLRASSEDTAEEEARLTAENEKLNATLEENDRYLEAAHAGVNNWTQQLNNAEVQLNNTSRAIEDNNKYLEEAKNNADHCATSIDEFGKKAKDAESGTDNLGGSLNTLGDVLASAGLAEMFGKIVSTLKDLSDELATANQTIVRMTGASGDALTDMSRIAQEVFSSSYTMSGINDAATVVGDLNTRLGVTGEELEKTAKLMDTFATATGENAADSVRGVTQVMNGYNLELSDMEGLLDKLTVAGQLSGVQISTLTSGLAQNQGVIQECNLSLDEAIGLYANLETVGVNASTVMRGFRTAVKNAADEGKSADEAIDDLIDQIKNAATETDALSIATDYFGSNAGPTMVNMIRNGKLDIDGWAEAIANSGGAMQETADNSITGAMEAEQAVHSLKTAFTESLGPALEDAQEIFAELINKVAEFVSDNPETTAAITGITTALTGLIAVAAGIKSIGSIATMLGITSGGVALVSGYGVALAAVAAAIYAIYEYDKKASAGNAKSHGTGGLLGDGKEIEEYAANVQALRTELERLQAAREQTNAPEMIAIYDDMIAKQEEEIAAAEKEYDQAVELAGGYDVLAESADGAAESADGLVESENGVTEAGTEADEATGNIISSLNTLAQAYSDAYEAAGNSIDGQVGLFGEFKASLSEDLDTADELLARWAEQTENLAKYTENLQWAAQSGLDDGLVKSLADGSAESAAYLALIRDECEKSGTKVDALGNETNTGVEKFNKAWENTQTARETLQGTMAGIEVDLEETVNNLQKQAADCDFSGFNDAFVDAFNNVGVDGETVGKNLGLGISAGIKASTKDASNAAVSQSNNVIDSAKNTYGVRSPSKVFNEIGQNLGAGLQNGINTSIPKANAAMQSGAQNISNTASNGAREAVNRFTSEFDQITGRTNSIIYQLISTVVNSMSRLPNDTYYIGQQMVNGMINGLYERSGSLNDAIMLVVNNAIQSAKNAAQVASPSKKTTELFEYVGEGMIVGIENEEDAIRDKMQEVVDNALRVEAKPPEVTAGIEEIKHADTYARDYIKTSESISNNTKNVTHGDTIINVYGAEGQDVNELAYIVSEKINHNLSKERAVWA